MTDKKLVTEVLGKVQIDAQKSREDLKGISELIKALKAQIKELSGQAGKLAIGLDPNSKEELAALRSKIRELKTSLSEFSTVGKARNLIDSGDITRARQLRTEVENIRKAIEAFQKEDQVRKGTFGLNPQTVAEGTRSLKELEKAATRAQIEFAKLGDTKGIKNLQATVEKNKQLIQSQVTNIQRQKMQADQDLFANLQMGKQEEALKRAHTAALAENAKRDKEVQAQRVKMQADQDLFTNLSLKKQQDSLARAHTQALAENVRYDKNVQAQRAKMQAEQDFFTNSSLKKQQEALEKAHTQAIAAEIKRNKDIAAARKKLEDEQALLVNKKLGAQQRAPELEAKNVQDAANRRLGLIGGVGGASLLAVQASLMANYSILQTITSSISQGIRTSIELEAAFRNIQAVTVTTNKEMTGLEAKIKDVAAASKFSSVEVAQAALILGQAGLNAKQTGDALKAVATLAVASGTSMSETVDLVTSVIGVFDKKASEALDVANKITAAANSSKVNVEKLTLAFQYAGNAAAQMGISFEETTAAMAAMSNAGIKSGSTMGTGLRAFLTETQKPTEEFIKIITALGLSLTDLDFKTHGLMGVAKNLREAGFIASDAIKSFDVRSAAAFNAMVANPEDLERQYKLLLDTNAGLAAEEVQMDSLKAQSERLKTSLGNLASAGFAPIGSVLKSIASGMATVAQGMSEWNIVIGAVGTAVGVVLTTAMAKYTVSLALGVASTLGLTTATAASISSMSAAAFATSALAKVKAVYAAAAAGASVSTLTLAGSLKLLSGISIFGALGIALTAATALFVGINYAMGEGKRKSDELRAALDASKGAYEEQVGVIDSLNRRIEELNHKSDSLAENQKAVEAMGIALTSQFGKEGYASDKLADSFAKQSAQLVKLRDLKQQAAKQSLELARLDAAAVTQNQEENLGSEYKRIQQRGLASRGIDQALNSNDIKVLSSAQVNILKEMQKALKTGDPKNPGPLASATEILRIVALKVKDDRFFGFVGRVRLYGEASEDLGAVSRKAGAVRESQSEQQALTIKAAEAEAARVFAEAKVFDGKTFTEAIRDAKSVGIEQRVIASGAAKGPNGKTDPLQLHTLAMAETRKSMDKLTEVEKILEERRINTTNEAELSAIQVLRTEVNARQEALKVSMDRLTEQTQPAAEREEKRRKGAAVGSDRQKNKDVSAEEIRANTLAEAQFKYRGIINPVIQQSMIDADVKGGEQRATNTRTTGFNATAATLRQFKLAEEMALREAKEAQQNANLAGSHDSAQRYLEDGLAARAKAREAALAQLKAKLKEDSEVGGSRPGLTAKERELEMKNFNETEDLKDRDFVQGFTGFANVAQAKLQQVRASTNEARQDLLDLQNKNRQANFERGEPARELQERVDVNTSLADPRGENLTLQRTLKRELVAVDKQYLVSKEAEVRLETQIIQGAEAELALMEASLSATQKKVDELQKLHDLGKGFMTEQQEQEFVAAKTALPNQQMEVRNQRALVAAARRQRTDTQQDLYTTRARIRGNLVPEIQEVNLQNLSRAMDDVWAKWQNISANMDIIRTMREGFGDQINTVTNSLGQAFSVMSIGTKSVSGSFRDMGISVVQSLLDITTHMAAMYAMQQMIGMVQTVAGSFGGMFGGGGALSAEAVSTMPGSIFSAPSRIPALPFGAKGGRMTSEGRFERVQYMSGGGPVRGGVTGRDSVPTMLMPEEFVLNRNVTSVVGTDFLHQLNSEPEKIVRKSAPGPRAEAADPTENKVLNVWIVTPDQAKSQGMGPNDIVTVIADNITRGGSVRKLIKQVNLGAI